jgi:hypothetical protein
MRELVTGVWRKQPGIDNQKLLPALRHVFDADAEVPHSFGIQAVRLSSDLPPTRQSLMQAEQAVRFPRWGLGEVVQVRLPDGIDRLDPSALDAFGDYSGMEGRTNGAASWRLHTDGVIQTEMFRPEVTLYTDHGMPPAAKASHFIAAGLRLVLAHTLEQA